MNRSPFTLRRLHAVYLACALSPLFLGATGNFNYPTANNSVPKTNAHGTGNADANSDVRYRIWKDDTLTWHVDGTAYSSGGWYLYIAGPMTPGTGYKASLYVDDELVDTESPVTIQN